MGKKMGKGRKGKSTKKPQKQTKKEDKLKKKTGPSPHEL